MKKEITISAPENETTGQKQRRLLTGIAVNPVSGHLNLSFDVQQLDLKGNPLAMQTRDTDSINFHSNMLNTPNGVVGGELPEYVSVFLGKIYALTEEFLTEHEALQEVEQPEGGDDEA